MNHKHHDMIEGRQAFNRFRDAMKSVLSVPKSAIPVTAKENESTEADAFTLGFQGARN